MMSRALYIDLSRNGIKLSFESFSFKISLGLLKDWGRRPEGGKRESIKIPRRNMDYISKST
jgi:hypothetical protein